MKTYRPAILILLAAIAAISVFYLSRPAEKAVTVREISTTLIEPVREAYGIPLTGINFCVDEVRPNQNLSEILLPLGVSYATIHHIAEKSRDIFDVRRIKAGNPFCIFQAEDSSESLRYFIYEKDPVNYVVFDLQDSVDIYEGKKDVELRQRTASGIVSSSLYETMLENDLPFALAIRMSEIYAWSIDFYRLQKGDRFRVIFDEKFIEGERVGVGKVQAAQFEHYGKDYSAFLYKQDSLEDYFDPAGFSLRKAFLKAPLKYSRISSGFTNRRFHPIKKVYTAHLGIDYAAPIGTPIYAVGDGVITKAEYRGNNGNYVKIRHNGTYSTQYLHMSRIGDGIKPGVTVQQGQVIGYVGSTGLSTGPHLCYRFWKNGKQVNPFNEEIPPAEPIREEHQASYAKRLADLQGQLSRIPFNHEAEAPL